MGGAAAIARVSAHMSEQGTSILGFYTMQCFNSAAGCMGQMEKEHDQRLQPFHLLSEA